MIHKLTDRVWFGNWEAPFECIGQVGTIINVAHNFSEHRGRHVYWQRLRELPYTTLYYRLAKKDREEVDASYIGLIGSVVTNATIMNRFPILTHCQMGGHRGPTSAIIAAWILSGNNHDYLEKLNEGALMLVPGLSRGRNYYQSAMKLMRELSQ